MYCSNVIGIADAAVVGVPSQTRSGELPRAYIVYNDGCHFTEDAVKQCIARMLASWKSLNGGVVLVDALPKTPSGKKLKRILNEWAATNWVKMPNSE